MRDEYPLLRATLAAEYAEYDGEQLDRLVQSIYGPGASAEDVESFFRNIGRGLQRAAGAVGGFAQKALPGVASGAATGAALGPWGALVGGIAGGAASLLSSSRNPTARGIGNAIGGVGNIVSTVRGGGGAGGLGSLASIGAGALAGAAPRPGGAAGGGSANALLGMLARPETMQAMLSSLLGAAGSRSVGVGGQQVPVSSMLSALGTLAGRAASEAAELEEGAAENVPEHVEWAEAQFGIDPEDAEGRTDALLALLALTPSLWATQNRPLTVNVTTPPPPLGSTQEWEAWEAAAAWEDNENAEFWESGEWSEGSETHAWA